MSGLAPAPTDRVEHTETRQEFALLAHVRGWCHNGNECALCIAEHRAHVAEQALGHTRRVLEIQRMQTETLAGRLDSVISG